MMHEQPHNLSPPSTQKYFPQHLKTSVAAIAKVTTLERAEKARKILLQEYFSSTSRVPELEGWLNLKDGYKKNWKKVFFILRASGLYYSTKGKQKVRQLACLLKVPVSHVPPSSSLCPPISSPPSAPPFPLSPVHREPSTCSYWFNLMNMSSTMVSTSRRLSKHPLNSALL